MCREVIGENLIVFQQCWQWIHKRCFDLLSNFKGFVDCIGCFDGIEREEVSEDWGKSGYLGGLLEFKYYENLNTLN